MNWQQWKTRYQRELQHPAGFEEKFVDLVLMNIPNLQPSDVIPQYHFKDSKGKNRYVDFMIINTQKNWLLPIELDGYTKMVGNGDDYERFQDFLSRQNDIIKIFGKVFRFSNKEFLTKSKEVIHTITCNVSVTSFDLFWFNFKITNIQNNPTIQDNFTHYDFIDNVLKPFAISTQQFCYGVINDCYIIDKENPNNPTIKIRLIGSDCYITSPYLTHSIRNFYENKNDIFTLLNTNLFETIKPQAPTTKPKPVTPKFTYQNLGRPKILKNWKVWYQYYDIEDEHPLIENFLKKLDKKANVFALKHVDDEVIIIHYYYVLANLNVALVISDIDTTNLYKGLDVDYCIRLSEDETLNTPISTITKINNSIQNHIEHLKQVEQQNKEKARKDFIGKLLLPFKAIGYVFKILGNFLAITNSALKETHEQSTKILIISFLEQIDNAKTPQRKLELQTELQRIVIKKDLSKDFINSCRAELNQKKNNP